jgi:hypothetical protein
MLPKSVQWNVTERRVARTDCVPTKLRGATMNKTVIELANTIHWDPNAGDKVYLERVQIVIKQFAFATRQVFMRFAGGPGLDWSVFDMDRFASAYLKMRGIGVPAGSSDPTNNQRPPRCDFVVPNSVMSSPLKKSDAKVPAKPSSKKLCARCRKRVTYSSDWYGDLCPGCADKTEGQWVCARCARKGDFEAMGGSGATNPKCCGVRCKRIKFD